VPVKLKELPSILVRNYLSRTNTFLRGKPAIGKTMTINAFADQMKKRIPDFNVWAFYAPTMSPMDIQASAPDYDSGKLRLFNNEALPNAYTHPDAKGIVFFGELPNTDPSTAKLLQKYVNGEDMSGVLRKPDEVVVIADGNRLEDKSSVQQQGRAFLSRFEQLEVYADAQDNMDYSKSHAWHPTVQLFFKDNAYLIDNYDEVFETAAARNARQQKTNVQDTMSEEGKLGIWANMRSWERISRKEYVADQLKSPLTLAELTGNLGFGVGSAYDAHKRVLAKLSSFEDIMANPTTVTMPTAPDEMFALLMIVALRCSEDQIDSAKKFGERLPLDMQAALLRNMAVRKGFNLAASKSYVEWISNRELTALLNGR
jgi:hypothetical protein